MDQKAGERTVSEQRKTRPVGDATERAKETGSAMRADTTSQNHCTADQERAQEGYISQFLLTGAGQGLHLRDLVRITHLSEREVRQMIQAERLRGIPILSNNQDGYFLPGNEAERDAFVRSMRHRADEIHRAAEAVEKAGLG